MTTGRKFSMYCKETGCAVIMSLYPAAPFFETRIRLCIASALNSEDINVMLNSVYHVGAKFKLIRENPEILRQSLLFSEHEKQFLSSSAPEDLHQSTALNKNCYFKNDTHHDLKSDTPYCKNEDGILKMKSLVDEITKLRSSSYNENDFLGISRCINQDKAVASLEKYQLGACGPPLFYGTYDAHYKLQNALKDLYGTLECSVYSNGFNGTVSIISTLAQPLLFERRHVMLCDERVNDRIKEGLKKKSRRVDVVFFKHNDVSDFQKNLDLLVNGTKGRLYITLCLEGIFEKTGNVLPLDHYMKLLENIKQKQKKKFDYILVVSEEVSFGLLTPILDSDTNRIKSCSLLSHFGMEIQDPLKCPHIFYGSFSFAIGSQGGFVGANFGDMCLLLSNKAYAFSANSPPASAALALSNIERMKLHHTTYVQELTERVAFLRNNLNSFFGNCVN